MALTKLLMLLFKAPSIIIVSFKTNLVNSVENEMEMFSKSNRLVAVMIAQFLSLHWPEVHVKNNRQQCQQTARLAIPGCSWVLSLILKASRKII